MGQHFVGLAVIAKFVRFFFIFYEIFIKTVQFENKFGKKRFCDQAWLNNWELRYLRKMFCLYISWYTIFGIKETAFHGQRLMFDS